jgi:TonB family protein
MRSSADPSGFVRLRPLSSGAIFVDAGKRFDAVGYLDGTSFIGLARTPVPIPEGEGHSEFGLLKFHLVETGPIEAVFMDLAGRPVRSETWTSIPEPTDRRVDGGVIPPNQRERPSTNDSLPGFGEYVYVEELPEAITKVAPEYPGALRSRNLDGTVMIQALVGKDGLVKDTRVVKSIPELDEYAIAAVKQWRFKPAAKAGGIPVAVWVAIPVRFSSH